MRQNRKENRLGQMNCDDEQTKIYNSNLKMHLGSMKKEVRGNEVQ